MLSDFNASLRARISKSASLYGNKSANLIELNQLCKNIQSDRVHIKIPDIYPISDLQIKEHLKIHAQGWESLWENFISYYQKNDLSLANLMLKLLRILIIDAFKNYPLDISKLGLKEDEIYMVRSTGLEDGDQISNPGGNESIASVLPKNQEISNAIGKVVASYFSEKSLTQRASVGDDITKKAFMPVLIQTMISEKDAENIVVSGVIYAKNDITRIEAAPGLGELVVNSKGLVDTYDVTHLGTVYPTVYQKKSRLKSVESKEGSTISFVQNPEKIKKESSLLPSIAREIARIAGLIRNHYGKSMDIEFIYNHKNKVLNIVQARPIPIVTKEIKPSTIRPEAWVKIKKDPEIEKIPVNVIAIGGNKHRELYQWHTIIATHIDIALEEYLKFSPQSKKFKKAVIIEHPAPTTSHEAAQFNAVGIPVVQTSQIKKIENWLEGSAPLVLDIQHQTFVLNNDLFNSATFMQGLITSSISAKQTLLTNDYYPISETAKNYLPEKSIKNLTIHYQDLLTALIDIEGAKFNSENKEAHAGLHIIANFFAKLGTSANSSKRKTRLLIAAMRTIVEIDECLKDYRSENQEELLNLIGRLRALIERPPEEYLFSDSIKQIAMQNKLLKDVKVGSLTVAKRDYLAEFLKLNHYALTDSVKKAWKEFVFDCTRDTIFIPKLSHLLLLAHQYHLESELVNTSFMAIKKNVIEVKTKFPHGVILDQLYEAFEEINNTLKDKIPASQAIIESFNKRILEWGNPDKFDQLYAELKKETKPILELLTRVGSSPLCDKTIFTEIHKFIDCLDKTIKSFKGSPAYNQIPLDVMITRFSELLKIYYALMKQCVNLIPEDFFSKTYSKNDFHNQKKKEDILQEIEKALLEKSQEFKKEHLHPSGFFVVSAARIGSTSSFAREFSRIFKHITLEDIFSLIHQNSEASLNILSAKSHIPVDLLPETLKYIIKKVSSDQNNLSVIKHQHPKITLEFNIPLQNHGGRITVEYDTVSQIYNFTIQFFAPNHNQRMDVIKRLADWHGKFTDANILRDANYNIKTWVFENTWQFNNETFGRLFLPYFRKILDQYEEVINLDNPNELVSYRNFFSIYFPKEYPLAGCLKENAKITKALLNELPEYKLGLFLFKFEEFKILFNSVEYDFFIKKIDLKNDEILNYVLSVSGLLEIFLLIKTYYKKEDKNELIVKAINKVSYIELNYFLLAKDAEDFIKNSDPIIIDAFRNTLFTSNLGTLKERVFLEKPEILATLYNSQAEPINIATYFDWNYLFDLYFIFENHIEIFGFEPRHITIRIGKFSLFDIALRKFNFEEISKLMDKYIPNRSVRMYAICRYLKEEQPANLMDYINYIENNLNTIIPFNRKLIKETIESFSLTNIANITLKHPELMKKNVFPFFNKQSSGIKEKVENRPLRLSL